MVQDLSRNSPLDYCERFSFLMLYVEKVVYKGMVFRRVRIPMFVSLILPRTTGRECLLYICKYKQIIAQHGENFNGIIAFIYELYVHCAKMLFTKFCGMSSDCSIAW